MRQRKVDYDRIAPGYDRRFIDGGEQGATATALQALARFQGSCRILEVGCGTGHWLASLRSANGMRFGLDLSAE